MKVTSGKWDKSAFYGYVFIAEHSWSKMEREFPEINLLFNLGGKLYELCQYVNSILTNRLVLSQRHKIQLNKKWLFGFLVFSYFETFNNETSLSAVVLRKTFIISNVLLK